uniref:Hypothetical repeat protein n=1 Tax=Solanum tuberosum TaxID=4113 RepID=M1DZ96_SOLTU
MKALNVRMMVIVEDMMIAMIKSRMGMKATILDENMRKKVIIDLMVKMESTNNLVMATMMMMEHVRDLTPTPRVKMVPIIVMKRITLPTPKMKCVDNVLVESVDTLVDPIDDRIDSSSKICNTPHARTTRLQISSVAGGTHGNHPQNVGVLTVCTTGPWFTTCDPSPETPENNSKCRPTYRRSNYRPWAMSMD